MKRLVLVASGRPSFLTIAPVFAALKGNPSIDAVPLLAVRAGDLASLEPIASAFGMQGALRTVELTATSPIGETAELMLALERIFNELQPDFVVPGGHGNAAVAAAIAASRMGLPVVSIDAGLRSCDRSEPDEINRLVIDAAASLHFVSEHSGAYNLINEGYADEQINFVGNTVIDSLVAVIGESNRSEVLTSLGLSPKSYVTVILGMQSGPGDMDARSILCRVLESLAASTTVLLLCPETEAVDRQDAFSGIPGLEVAALPGYVDLLRVLKESIFVLTDTDEYESELTVMNVPCLSMRQTTARPSTVEVGTNVLVGFDEGEILEHAGAILSGAPAGKTLIPEKWDGTSSKRIVDVLGLAI